MITEPMEGAYNDGLAGFFKGQMVQLHNVQSHNVQLQNSQLPNALLPSASYRTSRIQNVQDSKHPVTKRLVTENLG